MCGTSYLELKLGSVSLEDKKEPRPFYLDKISKPDLGTILSQV